MNTLTPQIAAMYYGCNAFEWNNGRTQTFPCTIDSESLDRLENVDVDMLLILTPLSEITDEDAIEAAKILFKSHEQDVEGSINIVQRIEHGIELQPDDSDISVIITWSVGFSFFNNAVIVLSGDQSDAALPCMIQVQAINYLRSKSYDCDNLIQSGIAITSQKK